ncbi:hypothetical protein ACGF07_08325 [Kitasatospora sp. NPDC048194]|uniref:hypothetical protein n=1 Tax=Kitasatospora sp. NPDC048194 TaxID=3364045 RepID=UPI00371EE753
MGPPSVAAPVPRTTAAVVGGQPGPFCGPRGSRGPGFGWGPGFGSYLVWSKVEGVRPFGPQEIREQFRRQFHEEDRGEIRDARAADPRLADAPDEQAG